ncbi:MAG: DEAD/DEAH box helicase [Saprospiraceae bacterium]|nr:DEAD/DEAH box helicase [Saprospiraceae bacterium]MDZ4702514.1 DEAD/DEAH box helicase [Saprospiraceae bacterium]
MTPFKNLGLNDDLLLGIESLGFTTPTPIQELVIPAALESDNDLIALAHTGTGKTAAFGLPLLQLIDIERKGVQALILCPTRELCVQVASDLVKYAAHAHQYKVVAVYGGAPIGDQIRQLKPAPHIVVATPGRLVDLINRGVLKLESVSRVVLDEADEMLNMGFKESLDTILATVTTEHTTWLFSATMSNEVRHITRNYMSNPRELSSGGRNQTNVNIEHVYYLCHANDRYAALKRVVDATPGIVGLIFCRTKAETREVAEQMIRDGYDSGALHGDLTQEDRDRAMTRFREGNLQLLIATDVAARGIDVSNITHVINYGLPDDPEIYTHRSGRTGRAGRTGISITIITPKMEERIRQLERQTKATFKRLSIPTGDEVCEKQLFHIVQSIRDTEVQREVIEPFLEKIYEALADLTKEELIMRFASVEFNRFLAYYHNAPDINIQPKGARRDGASDRGKSSSGFSRLFVNIGEMDGVTKKEFIKILTQKFSIPSAAVGRIDISRSFLHFDIETGYVDKVRESLLQITVNKRKLRVDDASDRKGGGSDEGGGRKDRPRTSPFKGKSDFVKKKW